MAEPTISDFVAKQNKDIPFEERAKKFEVQLKIVVDEWGVTPWAVLANDERAIAATMVLKDLWEKKV